MPISIDSEKTVGDGAFVGYGLIGHATYEAFLDHGLDRGK